MESGMHSESFASGRHLPNVSYLGACAAGGCAAFKVLADLPDWQQKEQTAKVLALLAGSQSGLTKEEILDGFYADYATSSAQRRASLTVRLNKLLQRARARFQPLGVDVAFDGPTRRWTVRACDVR